MKPFIVITIGILLGVIRVWMAYNIPPESFSWLSAYKDTAHIFIGGLAVAWFYQPKWFNWQWWLFWGLNTVEVASAIGSRV